MFNFSLNCKNKTINRVSSSTRALIPDTNDAIVILPLVIKTNSRDAQKTEEHLNNYQFKYIFISFLHFSN